MKQLTLFLFFSFPILILAILLSSNRLNGQTYVNPLLGNIYIHDPVMIKQGNTYYAFHTGRLIQQKTSKDRITWSASSSTLGSTPSWFKTYVPKNDGLDCWAPDISYRSGKYWLYYSVSTFGSDTSAIGLATSPSLANPQWTDQGMVIRSFHSNNYNCIDPNAFQDTDGTLWLAFGSWWSGIKLVGLDTTTGKPLSTSSAITSLATRTSSSLGIEAPFLIKRNSYYYLFVSWDICCQGVNSTYNIRVGRATKVTGPYNDKSGVAMTAGGGTLIWAGDTRWKGPGHNGIIVDNDTVFCVFHSYDANDAGKSKLLIRPLYFDADDWPSFTPSTALSTVLQKDKREVSANIFMMLSGKFKLPLTYLGENIHGEVFTLQGKYVGNVKISNNIVETRNLNIPAHSSCLVRIVRYL